MMKKILFVITLILLFVAYNNLHELISNSVYGVLNADGKLTDIHRGWDAVVSAWPIALAGALVLAVPGALGLALLYARAAAADKQALMSKIDEQLENARHAVANARAEAEKSVESRSEAALNTQMHAERLISQAQQIRDDSEKQIAAMAEKVADADARRHRAFEGFNRIKRKNQQLEAGIAALISASAGNVLKDLGLLNDDDQTTAQTAQEDETL